MNAHGMTIAELASHSHTANADGQTGYGSAILVNTYDKPSKGYYAGTAYVGSGGLFNIWGSLTYEGGSQRFNVMQPFTALNAALRI